MSKKLILSFLYRINKLIRKFDLLRNFYFPNLIYILEKKNHIGENVVFVQRTKFTGVGLISIGKNSSFGYKVGGGFYQGEIEIQTRSKDAKLTIGENVSTNNNVFVSSAGNIIIGNNVLIGRNVTIMDYEAHGFEIEKRRQMGAVGSVSVGDNSWIGNNVIILKDTIIGENTIVAAGAVVKGIFEGNVVIGGIPAKIIKKIND